MAEANGRRPRATEIYRDWLFKKDCRYQSCKYSMSMEADVRFRVHLSAVERLKLINNLERDVGMLKGVLKEVHKRARFRFCVNMSVNI